MTAAHELSQPGDTVVTLMPGVRTTVKRDDSDVVKIASRAVVLALKPGESQKDPMTHEAFNAARTSY